MLFRGKKSQIFTKGERVLVDVSTFQTVVEDNNGINHWYGYSEPREARIVTPFVKPRAWREHVGSFFWGPRVEIQLGDRTNSVIVYQRDLKQIPIR